MQKKQYTLEDFDFDLPGELIAQYPAETRDASRLFVLDRRKGTYIHTRFSRLHEFLKPGDLLVFNDARVIPARIACSRATGGTVEILLVRQVGGRLWLAASNRTKRIRPGEILMPLKNSTIRFVVKKRDSELLEIEPDADLTEAVLSSIGEIALPPYIRRKPGVLDEERYQTVYAREGRAAASPTAGLHFTEGLMERVRAAGAAAAFVTLDVSWGTFRPVRSRRIQDHVMHRERYTLSEEAARSVNRARGAGSRIVAVGTTALRVLETTLVSGKNEPGSGETELYLYPPKTVQSAEALITNFHTPRSTLLMLVCAFAGYDTIMEAYREAVKERYRFFSYGDAMLIV